MGSFFTAATLDWIDVVIIAERNYDELTDYLIANGRRDEAAREFMKKIVPGADNILGVKLPVLHKFAKELAHDNNLEELIPLILEKQSYHEEKMLVGDLIGYVKNPELSLKFIEDFLPIVDTWDICDVFASRLKTVARKNPEVFKILIDNSLDSGKPWRIRFGLVLWFSNFLEQEQLEYIFRKLEKLDRDLLEKNYYLRMGIAWCLSYAYFIDNEKVCSFIDDNRTMDLWTRRKSYTKMVESIRITTTQREEIKHRRSVLR